MCSRSPRSSDSYERTRGLRPPGAAVTSRLTELCSAGGCAAKYDPNLLGLLVAAASTQARPDVLVGLAQPDDAAVLRTSGDSALVFSVDFFPPIVDDPHDFGRIAANNALGDIFAMGGRPCAALAIAAIPADLPTSVPREIVEGATRQCEAAGALLVGGHTITAKEPIFGLAVVGSVDSDDVWRRSGAEPGDALVLTKPLGSGLIITARRRGDVDEETFERAVRSMRESNGPVADIVRDFRPSAVTDVTGFGLLGHAAEMARASRVQLAVELAALPIIDGAHQLAARGIRTSAHDRNRAFVANDLQTGEPPDDTLMAVALDPQTAGGLLIALAEERVDQLLATLTDAGLAGTRVGSVQQGSGLLIR